MSLKLQLVSQVNSVFPGGLRGDGKREIKQSFISDPQTASDPNVLYPKQNLVDSAKIHKLTSEICLYLNISS